MHTRHRRSHALIKTLILLASLSGGMAFAGTINKCINAQGQLEYSELPCQGFKLDTKIKNEPVPSYEGDHPPSYWPNYTPSYYYDSDYSDAAPAYRSSYPGGVDTGETYITRGRYKRSKASKSHMRGY